MVKQSAIFVDAGFLLAVGGTQVAGTSLRSAFLVDFDRLIRGILDRTVEHSGLNALRVYWYDASKDALFTDQHKQIGLLPDVKVRLGRISFNGEQKGVDLKLGLDLVGVARNRAASIAYLVSGDDDLAEAVEEAQDLGMKVVLVGLENPGHRLGVMSVAEHLALRVDSIITLPADLVEACFTKSVTEAPRPLANVPTPAGAHLRRPPTSPGLSRSRQHHRRPSRALRANPSIPLPRGRTWPKPTWSTVRAGRPATPHTSMTARWTSPGTSAKALP